MKSDITLTEYEARFKALDHQHEEAKDQIGGRFHRKALRVMDEVEAEKYDLTLTFWGKDDERCVCDRCDYSFAPDEVSEDDAGLLHCTDCTADLTDAAYEAEQDRKLFARTAEENYAAAWAQKQALTR